MPNVAALLLGDNLEIRYGRVKHGVPVDQSFAPVDEALVVELDESLGNRFGQTFVHRKALVAPIDRCAHSA